MKVICLLAAVAAAVAAPSSKLFPKTGREWTTESLINPEELGEFYEGDIMLPLPPRARNGILDENYRWDNGVVHYDFAAAFTEQQKATVRQSMDEYESLTGGCITFVERSHEHDYIHFTQDDNQGCYSYVGKQGGRQTINYPQWCLDRHGSTMHEMYHALGFYHEQSRFDRDDYVTIMWNNIEAGAEHNFDKYSSNVIGGFGEQYDYGSVMHYSAYAFSSNGQKTIVTLDPDATIGQRVGLSEIDLRKLMNMYNC
ncbi:zinc metalloproteinase nas-4-like [Penaeus monodon]|uniref:zinc metalloproteinase nas-4-like n=1 Tax=Penaeus monodon TaxID=6687 RepID=UPI0018A76C31|nr:zinc metalloproteinase nas-4-like [Penaeus monodon]